LDQGHRRLDVVFLRIAAHHIRRPSLGLKSKGLFLALFLSPIATMLNGGLGEIAATKEHPPQSPPDPAEQSRNRSPGDHEAPDDEHQDRGNTCPHPTKEVLK